MSLSRRDIKVSFNQRRDIKVSFNRRRDIKVCFDEVVHERMSPKERWPLMMWSTVKPDHLVMRSGHKMAAWSLIIRSGQRMVARIFIMRSDQRLAS